MRADCTSTEMEAGDQLGGSCTCPVQEARLHEAGGRMKTGGQSWDICKQQDLVGPDGLDRGG